MPSVPNFDADAAALQAAIAMGGERGQAQYAAEQAAIQQSTAGALATLGGIQNTGELHGTAEHGAQMTAQQQALSQLYSNTASQGSLYFNQDIQRLNAANQARYQQAQVAAQAAAGRGQREAALERERLAFEREQMQWERERHQRELEQIEAEKRLGTIRSDTESGRALGWEDEYTSGVTQAGARDTDGDPTTGDERGRDMTPYQMMQQAADAVSAEGGTWAEVQNAVVAAANQWKSTYGGHDYPQAAALVLAQYAPRFEEEVTAAPMPKGWMSPNDRAQAAIKDASERVWGALSGRKPSAQEPGWNYGRPATSADIPGMAATAARAALTADEVQRVSALADAVVSKAPVLTESDVLSMLAMFPEEVRTAIWERLHGRSADGKVTLTDMANAAGVPESALMQQYLLTALR